MSTSMNVTLAELFHTMPVRSALHTIGPLVIAVAQLVNSYVHELSLLYPALFGLVMIAFSVMITRYNMVELRTTTLEQTWITNR